MHLTPIVGDFTNPKQTDELCASSDQEVTREEFANWTVNSHLLYDFVANHTLEWPSMTVDALPLNSFFDNDSPPHNLSSDETVQPILLGSFTGGEEPNYLLLVDAIVPSNTIPGTSRAYMVHSDFAGFDFGTSKTKFRIRRRIPLEVESNRALHMPQLPHIAVTVGPGGLANIVDLSLGKIIAKLKGHTAEAWGAEWNPSREGFVATVAEDLKTCIWDVHNPAGCISPVKSYKCHTASPQDVSWKRRNSHIFASVGDDGRLFIVDCRCPTPSGKVMVSSSGIYSVCYSTQHDYLLATGGCDQDIILWDDRQLDYSLHRMAGHEKPVNRVTFNCEEDHFLASSSQDKRVIIWDLRRIGMEQRPEDADDGPAELLFSHGGHTSCVNDACWTTNVGGNGAMVISASDDNQLQVWQMSTDLFKNEDGDADMLEEADDFDVEDDEQ